MFQCDYYPNHEICKNKKMCEFWIPLNQKIKQLNQEISYELYQLEKLYQRKRDFFKIQTQIKNGMYSKTVKVNGKLKRIPKKNFFGEEILKSKHVQVGLDYNIIVQEINDTENIIRELKRREQNILKILKKRL